MTNDCDSNPTLRQTIKQPQYELGLYTPQKVCAQQRNGSYYFSDETAFVKFKNTSNNPIVLEYTNLGTLSRKSIWEIAAPKFVLEDGKPVPIPADPSLVKTYTETIPSGGSYKSAALTSTVSPVLSALIEGTTLDGEPLRHSIGSPRKFGVSFIFRINATIAGHDTTIERTLQTEIDVSLLPDPLPKD